jgi:hypothetical protein
MVCRLELIVCQFELVKESCRRNAEGSGRVGLERRGEANMSFRRAPRGQVYDLAGHESRHCGLSCREMRIMAECLLARAQRTCSGNYNATCQHELEPTPATAV